MLEESYRNIQTNYIPVVTLYTINESGRKARLLWAERDNRPRIIMYPNHLEKGENVIQHPKVMAAMHFDMFHTFVTIFKEVMEKDNSEKSIEYYNSLWEDGEKVKDIALISTLKISNTDGTMGLELISEQDKTIPNIKFEILLGSWNRVLNNEKEAIGKYASDKLAAKSYISTLEKLITKYCIG